MELLRTRAQGEATPAGVNATDGGAGPMTQNRALHALLFLYEDVIGTEPGWLDDFIRAKRPKRHPDVRRRKEVKGRFCEC